MTIPGSIADIGDYAFSGCSDLTNVNIPTGANVGANAFESTPMERTSSKSIESTGVSSAESVSVSTPDDSYNPLPVILIILAIIVIAAGAALLLSAQTKSSSEPYSELHNDALEENTDTSGAWVCEVCGTENDADAAFCGNCGTKKQVL